MTDDITEYYDEDELEDLYEDSQDDVTPEDVFSMVTINKLKKIKVTAILRDEEDNEIELSEVIEQLMNWMKDQMEDSDSDDNKFADQIFPLMSQSMVSGLGRLIGIHPTAFIVGNDMLLHSTIHMMCLGFLLLKFVQKHGLTIHTYEEEVSQDEIDELERKHKASSVAHIGAMMGMDPKEILRNLVSQGRITQEDLESLMPEASVEEETTDTEPEDGESQETPED